ncbi:hypothetical protein R0131_18000 [Clostridium sp. AL.422]|uniref:hypothetical protein n=1 Tax=Clostridium TaxID=1485 RepID=UPI00293DAE79|nr:MULTISPECIES: hypothetical protein [unclassified Clostridium]MDV4152725.1 hypothetical protein [Clostridium sp. AL.422]
MGVSGELQHILPILMIAVAINYAVANFEVNKPKYIEYIFLFCYIGGKILLYNSLKINDDLIIMHIIAFILINISFIFRNKIYEKTYDAKKILWNLDFGVFYGYAMLAAILYIPFNERLYINKYNLIIMYIEYIVVGVFYILASKYMIRKIEKTSQKMKKSNKVG